MLRLPPDLVIQPIVPDSGIPPLAFGAELPAPHDLRLAAPSIVLRNPQLDEQPWTYLRFSKQFHEIREDVRQLGTLTPLKEFVESL